MFEKNENNPKTSSLGASQKSGEKQSKTKSMLPPLQPSPPNSQKRSIKRLGPYEFSFDQRIGSGMTGDAYVGMNCQNCQLVCVKVIDRNVFKTPSQQLLLDNQIRCQQACNSNYTVKLYDIFDTSSFCFIVTEFCEGGDLYRCLRSTPNGMPEEIAIKYAKQIGLALKKLKDVNIIHRDVKSENILIQNNKCKLGDFGFAIEESNLQKQKKFNLGSPLYMSIQALQNSLYSYASDIFAYGVVLYQMLHRQSPWECSDEKQLLLKMKTQTPSFKSGISDQFKSLIRKCLSQNSQDRPTIEQIMSNPLFTNIKEDTSVEWQALNQRGIQLL